MTETPQSRAARLAHLRRAELDEGRSRAAAADHGGDVPPAGRSGRLQPVRPLRQSDLGCGRRAARPSRGRARPSPFRPAWLRSRRSSSACCKTGDRILLPSDGYYTTRVLADRFLKPMGVAIDTRADRDAFSTAASTAIASSSSRRPSNPSLDICDIAAVAAAAHQAGAIVVADNTTMTPYGQRPLDLGADVVVAADTKAPNGHSDVLFGHVTSRNPEIIAAVKGLAQAVGRDPRPVRGMAGPSRAGDAGGPLRPHVLVGRDDRRRGSPGIPRSARVRFPGLPDDPAHNLARMQMDRFGFLIGLTLARRAGGGSLHRRLRADPAGHLVRRRAQLGRTPRPLGRRRGAGLCQAVGRLRAGRGIVEGACAIAGFRSSALGTRAQRQASAFHRVAYWCSTDDAYDMKHRHAALAAQREAIVGQ